ncbi:MAG: hypothetical protein AB8C84_03410 [Oligoflexales bacterium]
MKFRNLCFLMATTPLWVSCGDDDNGFLEEFNYGVEDQLLSMEVEFNSDTELSVDFEMPVKDYGAVRFYPSSDEMGFRVGFDLDLGLFDNIDALPYIEQTGLLPNGSRMSRYVDEDLFRLQWNKDSDISGSLYVGSNPDNFYLGGAVELGYLNEDFPSGLVITQRIRDHKKRPLGVVTIFGPKVENDRVVAPGGIFFMTKVTDLLSYLSLKNRTHVRTTHFDNGKIWMNKKAEKQMKSKKKRKKLKRDFRNQTRDAGY